MGNCYSSGTGPELETSLDNVAARPNQRQQATFDEASLEKPEMPAISKEEELRELVKNRGEQANYFVSHLQTSHPQLFKDNVSALLQKFGNFDYVANAPATTQFEVYALEYRPA